MFFLFAVLSMFGYAIQGTFLVKYARRTDGLSLAVYRNLTLAISMVPLLFLADDFLFVTSQTILLLAASAVCGALSLTCRFRAQKSLPVGVDAAFSGTGVLMLLFLGYVFWNETLSGMQLFFIFLTLLGVLFLTLQDHHMPHLDGRTRQGVFFSILNNVFGSVALFLMGMASRQSDPRTVAYLWEVFIAGAAVLLVILRWLWRKEKIQPVTPSELLKIGLISSWTLVGTGGLALAVALGPIGIVSAIGSAGIAVGTVFSHFLYHERLKMRQLLIIGGIILSIVGLRLVSG